MINNKIILLIFLIGFPCIIKSWVQLKIDNINISEYHRNIKEIFNNDRGPEIYCNNESILELILDIYSYDAYNLHFGENMGRIKNCKYFNIKSSGNIVTFENIEYNTTLNGTPHLYNAYNWIFDTPSSVENGLILDGITLNGLDKSNSIFKKHNNSIYYQDIPQLCNFILLNSSILNYLNNTIESEYLLNMGSLKEECSININNNSIDKVNDYLFNFTGYDIINISNNNISYFRNINNIQNTTITRNFIYIEKMFDTYNHILFSNNTIDELLVENINTTDIINNDINYKITIKNINYNIKEMNLRSNYFNINRGEIILLIDHIDYLSTIENLLSRYNNNNNNTWNKFKYPSMYHNIVYDSLCEYNDLICYNSRNNINIELKFIEYSESRHNINKYKHINSNNDLYNHFAYSNKIKSSSNSIFDQQTINNTCILYSYETTLSSWISISHWINDNKYNCIFWELNGIFMENYINFNFENNAVIYSNISETSSNQSIIIGQGHNIKTFYNCSFIGLKFVHRFENSIPFIKIENVLNILITNSVFKGHLSVVSPAIIAERESQFINIDISYNSFENLVSNKDYNYDGIIHIINDNWDNIIISDNEFSFCFGTVINIYYKNNLSLTYHDDNLNIFIMNNIIRDCTKEILNYNNINASIFKIFKQEEEAINDEKKVTLNLIFNVIINSNLQIKNGCYMIKTTPNENDYIRYNSCPDNNIFFLNIEIFNETIQQEYEYKFSLLLYNYLSFAPIYIKNSPSNNINYNELSYNDILEIIGLNNYNNENNNNNITSLACSVSPTYKEESTLYYGFIYFKNLENAIKYCPQNLKILIKIISPSYIIRNYNRNIILVQRDLYGIEGEPIKTGSNSSIIIKPILKNCHFLFYPTVSVAFSHLEIINENDEYITNYNPIFGMYLKDNNEYNTLNYFNISNISIIHYTKEERSIDLNIKNKITIENSNFIGPASTIYDTNILEYDIIQIKVSHYNDNSNSHIIIENNIFYNFKGTMIKAEYFKNWNISRNVFINTGICNSYGSPSLIRLRGPSSYRYDNTISSIDNNRVNSRNDNKQMENEFSFIFNENRFIDHFNDINHQGEYQPISITNINQCNTKVATSGILSYTIYSAIWIEGFVLGYDYYNNNNNNYWIVKDNYMQENIYPLGMRITMVDEYSISTNIPENWIGVSYKNVRSSILENFYHQNNQYIRGSIHDILLGSVNDLFGWGITCDNGCITPPPNNCIVNQKNNDFNDMNLYYNTWLFTSIFSATNGCIDDHKNIELYSDIYERLIIHNTGWTVFSDNLTRIDSYIHGKHHKYYIPIINLFCSDNVISSSISNISFSGINIIRTDEKSHLFYIMNQYSSQDNNNNPDDNNKPSLYFKNVHFHCTFGEKDRESLIYGEYNVISFIDCHFYYCTNIIIFSSNNVIFENNIWNDFENNAIHITNTLGVYIKNNIFIRKGSLYTNDNDQQSDIGVIELYNCSVIEINYNSYYQNIESDVYYVERNPPQNSLQIVNNTINMLYNNSNMQSNNNNSIEIFLASKYILSFIAIANINSSESYVNLHGNIITNSMISLRLENITNLKTRRNIRNYMRHMYSGNSISNFNSLWHDIIFVPDGYQSFDKIKNIPPQYICDSGCETDDIIAISSIVILLLATCLCVCCIIGFGEQPIRIQYGFSKVFNKMIPTDSEYIPNTYNNRNIRIK